RANMTACVVENLHPSHRPRVWKGTYLEVLPYVREAFERALVTLGQDFERQAPHLRERLIRVVRELCDPDPGLRGDPKERRPGANQFSLERYVALFDLLAAREEIGGGNR